MYENSRCKSFGANIFDSVFLPALKKGFRVFKQNIGINSCHIVGSLKLSLCVFPNKTHLHFIQIESDGCWIGVHIRYFAADELDTLSFYLESCTIISKQFLYMAIVAKLAASVHFLLHFACDYNANIEG